MPAPASAAERTFAGKERMLGTGRDCAAAVPPAQRSVQERAAIRIEPDHKPGRRTNERASRARARPLVVDPSPLYLTRAIPIRATRAGSIAAPVVLRTSWTSMPGPLPV
jgi:hypothetical protein